MALPYRRDIDGLRAFAIISVVLFHIQTVFYDTAFTVFRGGFVGVDIFFVISGFLITNIIYSQLNDGSFSFRKFWLRRARRLIPALIPISVFGLLLGWILFTPKHFQDLGGSIAAQSVFLSNIFFWVNTGYFTEPTLDMPMLHTWTLAIEEQYYLFFPIILFFIFKFKNKYLIPIIILFLLLSFFLNIWGAYNKPGANFYLIPTRAWEFLIGSMVAFILANRPDGIFAKKWIRETISILGLICITIAVGQFTKKLAFPGWYAAIPCCGTALIILAGVQPTSISRFLSLRPLVWIGSISYSLYLWHWPILVFYNYRSSNTLTIFDVMLIIGFSFLLSYLSFKYIETPFRTRVFIPDNNRFILTIGSITAVAGVIGLLIYLSQGVPSRISAEAVQYANGSFDRPPADICTQAELGDLDKSYLCRVGKIENDHKKILLLGDSHAETLLATMQALSIKYDVEVLYSPCHHLADIAENCQPVLATLAKIIEDAHIAQVILVSRWGFFQTELPERGTPEFFQDEITAEELESRRIKFTQGINYTINFSNKLGVNISILNQVPEHRFFVPKTLYWAVKKGEDPLKIGRPIDEHLKRTEFSRKYFASLPKEKVSIMDPTGIFCGLDNFCLVARDGHALYIDDDHLSTFGAHLLTPLFEPIFASSAR